MKINVFDPLNCCGKPSEMLNKTIPAECRVRN